MKLKQFEKERRALTKDASIADIHTSPDFQCNQTNGFPTSICVYWAKGKAWLELNEWVAGFDEDLSEYKQGCADFGIRDCHSVEDFDAILKELGEDAIQSAGLTDEEIEELENAEETEDIGMGGIQ